MGLHLVLEKCQGILIPPDQHYFHTLSNTTFSDTPPNTPSGACDYGNLAFKMFHNRSFGFLCVCMSLAFWGGGYFRIKAELDNAGPVYEFAQGWSSNITDVRQFDELPHEARLYVERVEALLDTPVTMISVGPEREAIIRR